MIKKVIFSLLIVVDMLFGFNNIDLNVNTDTLEVSTQYDLREIYNLSEDASYLGTISYLSNEAGDSTNRMASLGFHIKSPYFNDSNFSFGFGCKFLWMYSLERNFLALPLTLFVDYEVNEDILFNVIYGYAPKVLALSDSKTLHDLKIKINYKIIDQGYIYMGARYVRSTYVDDSYFTFDSNFFLGFTILF